jgi:uncharacterized membrane protein (DUF485 family)
MPMLWRRIAWFASFAVAVVLVLWMRSLNFSWLATLSTAAVTYVVLPFVISQACAAFILGRIHSRLGQVSPDKLADTVADAIKALPPNATEDEKVEAGKRAIEETFKWARKASPMTPPKSKPTAPGRRYPTLSDWEAENERHLGDLWATPEELKKTKPHQ